MGTIAVKDANGTIQNLEVPLATENNTLLTTISSLLTTANTALSTANTHLASIDTEASSTTDSPVEPHQPSDVITFTPTLDTSTYASGDVLFATTAIPGVSRANDLRTMLTSLTVIDKAKQNAAFTLMFYQSAVTSAAFNAPNAMSDSDQATCLGFVNIAAADWLTFANNSVLCYSGAKAPNLLLEPATGTTTVYVVAVLQAGTPAFGPNDLVFKLGFVQQ